MLATFLEAAKIILSLLPTIITVVKQLEELFPESGQGKMKFALIASALESTQATTDKYLPYVESTINAVVDVFNKFGLFTKE